MDRSAQLEELDSLKSIYYSEEFQVTDDSEENKNIEVMFLAFLKLQDGYRVRYIESLDSSEPSFLEVKHLPPIELLLTLPEDYPSKNPPKFIITCQWLSKADISLLCMKLDEIWMEHKGVEIIYMWCDFLKNDSLAFLEYDDELDITQLHLKHLSHIQKMRELEGGDKENVELNNKGKIESEELKISEELLVDKQEGKMEIKGEELKISEELLVDKQNGKIENESEKLKISEELLADKQNGKMENESGQLKNSEELLVDKQSGKMENDREELKISEELLADKQNGKMENESGQLKNSEELLVDKQSGKMDNEREKLKISEELLANKQNGKMENESGQLKISEELLTDKQNGKMENEGEELKISEELLVEKKNGVSEYSQLPNNCAENIPESSVNLELVTSKEIKDKHNKYRKSFPFISNNTENKLSPYKKNNFKFNYDERAMLSLNIKVSLVRLLENYNVERENVEFLRNFYTCNICFCDKLGKDCTKFKDCNHVFCVDCIKSYFTVKIKDGTVQSITCPEDQCTTEALPSQIKEIVSEELYAKYDSVLLNTALDTLNDIVYCPRQLCQYPVSWDPSEKMASCPNCQYVFCVSCRMVYHGIEPCRYKSSEARKIVQQYEKGSAEVRLQMEMKYGKKTLETLVNEAKAEDWIRDNSKACPKCDAAIEKSVGCNKMVCWKCNAYFCWLCLTILDVKNPYLHFRDPLSRCVNKLFYLVRLTEDEDDWDWVNYRIIDDFSDSDLDDDDDDDADEDDFWYD